MLILIDNYDSFTYNLVQYIETLGTKCLVIRNDKTSIKDLLLYKPKGFVISPGPGSPSDAGICIELVHASEKHNIPLLGVCLGHQAIGEAFGGEIVKARKPMHGKVSSINHTGSTLFAKLPNPINVTRYHSLIVNKDTLPKCLNITAESEDGEIMALEHKSSLIFGVQFHPESIASEVGIDVLENFTRTLQ